MSERKVCVAEDLAETLQQYAEDVENGDHDPFHDDYLVDSLCNMQEIVMADGVDEGRRYQHYMLITDKPVKLYEIVEIERMMSGTIDRLKVMAIMDIRPSLDGKIMVGFLGSKLKD